MRSIDPGSIPQSAITVWADIREPAEDAAVMRDVFFHPLSVEDALRPGTIPRSSLQFISAWSFTISTSSRKSTRSRRSDIDFFLGRRFPRCTTAAAAREVTRSASTPTSR